MVSVYQPYQGLLLTFARPSAEAATTGVSGAGPTWFPSEVDALPVWHARCRLGLHDHDVDPFHAEQKKAVIKTEADSDVFMSSPKEHTRSAPPDPIAGSSARTRFAEMFRAMPGHDPQSPILLVRGRPSVSIPATGFFQPGTPTLDLRTPPRPSKNKLAPAPHITPTRMRSDAEIPPSSPMEAASTSPPSSPMRAPQPRELFFAVQGGECVYSDRHAARVAYNRRLGVAGRANLCSTVNFDKAVLVAAGHDVEQAAAFMDAEAAEERMEAQRVAQAAQHRAEEMQRREEASTRRRLAIQAGVAERQAQENAERQRQENERVEEAKRVGKAARLAAITRVVGESSGKGKGKERTVSPALSEGSDVYDAGFEDLSNVNFEAVDALVSSQPCPPYDHRAAKFA